jgi:GTP-binding protein Era
MTTDGEAPAGFETVRSGFVALAGRPNAGKSTLANALVGEKVAIVSDKPQTTRHRLRAIVDADDMQLVLVDTPGLHKPLDALGDQVNRSALLAIGDVDATCLLVDATRPAGKGDAWVAERITDSGVPAVLVVTKTDLVDSETVEAQLRAARRFADFAEEAHVSAVSGDGLEGLLEVLAELLPDGPRYFPRDMRTDQPLEVMLAELVREKALLHTHEEVPHAVGVSLEELSYDEAADRSDVSAVLYVERESQKGILVGKGGSMIRLIGTEARADIERVLGTSVYLDLRVKVKKDWRRDASQIRRFGYGEGL